MKKTTPRYIKIKLLKPVIKRKCSLDSERHNMYREKKRMNVYFLSEIIQARRLWSDNFKVLKAKKST